MTWEGWSKTGGYLALLVALLLLPVFITVPYYLGVVIVILINILLATSIWLILLTGQASLCHAAFAAIGGYVSAALVVSYGFSFWLALLLAMATAGVIALIIGFITLRIKTHYFIIATLAFGEIVRIVFSSWEHPFGGLIGILNIPPPDPIAIPGLPVVEFATKPSFYYLTLALVLIAVVVLHRLDSSRIGLVFRSIAQADSLAEHVGINVMGYKVLAFVIGSMFAGLAGILYAFNAGCMLPSCFTVWQSIYCLIFVTVGGSANIAGPILGATFFTLISEVLRPIKRLEPIVYGSLLIVTMMFLRAGLLGMVQKLGHKFVGLISRSKLEKLT